MWIKLISPKTTSRPMDSAWKQHMAPPLALLVLAALTPAEHAVTLEDENVERVHLDDVPDLVGITVKVDTLPRAAVLASHYRAKGIPVVVGGGVKLPDIPALRETGVDGFFVVSAVAGAVNPKEAAHRLVAVWKEE